MGASANKTSKSTIRRSATYSELPIDLESTKNVKLHKELVDYCKEYRNERNQIEINSIERIQLHGGKIKDDGLTKLMNKDISETAILFLGDNELSNIKILDKYCFTRLKILHLDHNNIEDISPIVNFKMTYLESLSFYKNNLKTMKDLKNAHEIFPRLLFLDLGTNHIEKIIPLKIFSKLKKLNLFNNPEIKSINELKDIIFENLSELNLSKIGIEDITPLEGERKFPVLTRLRMNLNNIRNIKPLENFFMPKLECLELNYNQIESLNDLNNTKFLYLNKLYLESNNLTKLELKQNTFPLLHYLFLENNQIDFDSDKETKENHSLFLKAMANYTYKFDGMD